MQPHSTDNTRLFLTIMLAAAILMIWQATVEGPNRQKAAAALHAKQQAAEQQLKAANKSAAIAHGETENDFIDMPRDKRLALAPRMHFKTEKLEGSISLKGARFDDLTLSKYRMELDKNSPPITLFSPNGDKKAYFAQVGWVATDGKTKVPDQDTLWKTDRADFTTGDVAHLRWNNGAGVTFIIAVSLDKNYMFNINQRIENHSGSEISVAPYAYVNRIYDEDANMQHYAILHEGPLGVMEGALEEVPYSDLREAKKNYESASGWLGITDKYWLSALIPGQDAFKVNFSHYKKNDHDRYQIDYVAKARSIASGQTDDTNLRLFAGAKEIKVIDDYATGSSGGTPIPLFDRAVDFGVLYFLTKPMFLMLNFFYTHVGNFGVAILLLTICVKLLMFPLANKSYKAAAQMRKLQPEMLKLKERFGDDQLAMQKELLALYKREKVNPASGCLPVLVQMPVFFALYKVLFVTIEMRHAPFFGWLEDLSAIDPSNIFTLFGILDWNHPAWMHLGILPILMCATMVIQMKQQPKPTDPVQAKIIGYMPYFFLIIFASFPAGLVLYWVWSNMLSIAQQHVISRKYAVKTQGSK